MVLKGPGGPGGLKGGPGGPGGGGGPLEEKRPWWRA